MSDAKPMEPNDRFIGYMNTKWETPAQRRRRKHKLGHLAALERRYGYTAGLTKPRLLHEGGMKPEHE
jgi:hypothetical protein